jgi:hypothetical protein
MPNVQSPKLQFVLFSYHSVLSLWQLRLLLVISVSPLFLVHGIQFMYYPLTSCTAASTDGTETDPEPCRVRVPCVGGMGAEQRSSSRQVSSDAASDRYESGRVSGRELREGAVGGCEKE